MAQVAEKVWFKTRDGKSCLMVPEGVLDSFLRGLDRGEFLDSAELRGRLMTVYGGEMVCPVTVRQGLKAIGDWTFAELDRGVGVGKVAPVWRVIGPETSLGKRYGRDRVAMLRAAEVAGG